MTIRFNPRWLFVSVLLFSLQFCRAQIVVPSTLSFALGSSNAPESKLWDLNGSYVVEMLVERKGQAVPVQVAFTLIQSPSGKLSTTTNELVNAAVTFNNDDNSSFACQATVSGKVTGVNGVARAHFTVRFAGNGALGGQSTVIRGTFSVDAETDPLTGRLVGVKASKFSATFPGLTSINGVAEFDSSLPSGVDGSWNLTLHLVGLNKLVGTAVIHTPIQNLGLDLTGKFQKGLLVVKGQGAGDVQDTVTGAGSSATILLPPTFDTIQLSGKILGQKLNFNVSVPDQE